MNRKSFFKKLLAVGVGAVCVTTGAMFAACSKDDKDKDKDNPNEPTGHTHVWGDWYKDDADNHWKLCTASGHGTQGGTSAQGYGAHDYDNDQDTTCNTCGHVRTVQGEDPGHQDPPVQQKETVEVDIAELGDKIAADAAVKSGLGITATSEMVVDASSKTLTYAGKTVTTTKRIKPNGNGSKTQKSLKVELDRDATVIVYGASGTSGKTAYLNLLDAEGTAINGAAQQVADGVNGNVAYAAVFTVKANTVYYVVSDTNAGSNSANAVINYIAVVYGTFTESKGELVPAVSADCTTGGNVSHYCTEYGRYLGADGTTVLKPSDVYTQASGHNYTYTAADVTVPSTTEGSVVLHCGNSGCTDSTKNAVLPVLSSDAYTSRPQVGESGEYKITVEGVQVIFTAVGVAEQSNWSEVYTNNFATGTVDFIADIASVTSGGLYWNTNDTSVTGTTDTYSVTVVDNALKIHDAGAKTTNAFIRLNDAVTTSGSVKISGKVTLGANNGSWTFLQLLNSSNEEFVGLRTSGTGKIGVRIESSNTVVGEAAFTKNTEINFEIVINYTTNAVTVTIDSNTAITATLGTAKGTNLNTIKFATADTATDRDITLSEITVSKQ